MAPRHAIFTFGFAPEAAAEQSILHSLRIKSILLLPIYDEKRVFGALGFDTVADYRHWTESEIKGLTVLAQIFSNALSTVDAEQEILGFGQLLTGDTELAPQHADSSRGIVTAGNHLLNLVNEVLDLARIDSGRVDLSLEAVSCPEVIAETVSLIEPFAKKEEYV